MVPTEKQTLSGLLRTQAKKFGPKIFLLWQDTELTYAELDIEADRIANALIQTGVNKGEKVALMMENCSLYVSGISTTGFLT